MSLTWVHFLQESAGCNISIDVPAELSFEYTCTKNFQKAPDFVLYKQFLQESASCNISIDVLAELIFEYPAATL